MVLFATIEFAHAMMTVQVLNAGARRAARQGVISRATNATIESEAQSVIQGCVNPRYLKVEVHDGAVFDSTADFESIEITSLDSIEVGNLAAGDLFIVRTSVKLSDTALISPRWLYGEMTLSGRSVARRE